ncbi:MAG: hypothetical protein ACMZ64_09725 [Oleiphilus sp.]
MGKTKDAQANPCQSECSDFIIAIYPENASVNASFLNCDNAVNKKLHFAIVYQQTFFERKPIIELSSFEWNDSGPSHSNEFRFHVYSYSQLCWDFFCPSFVNQPISGFIL